MAVGGLIDKITQYWTGTSPLNFAIDMANRHPDGSMGFAVFHVEVTYIHVDADNHSYCCVVQNSCMVVLDAGVLSIRPATYTHPESFGLAYIAIGFTTPGSTTLRVVLTKSVGTATINGHISISIFGSPGFE